MARFFFRRAYVMMGSVSRYRTQFRRIAMQVVYGIIDIHLPYSRSLKEKRKTIKSMVERMRSRFNVSIIEADYHDLWQRCQLAFAVVGGDQSEVTFIVDAMEDTVNSYDEVEVTSFSVNYAL
jgi:uncharacterized protein YlxP (DUF503 family)